MKRRFYDTRIVYCSFCKKKVFTKGPGFGAAFRCGECDKVQIDKSFEEEFSLKTKN